MESFGFEIPDPFILNDGNVDVHPSDSAMLNNNWCLRAYSVMMNEYNNPWEERMNIAFWHGETGSGRVDQLGFHNWRAR